MDGHNHRQYALNPVPIDALSGPYENTKHENARVGTSSGIPTEPALGQAFCQFCGGRVAADAVLCVTCGRQIKSLQGASAPVETKTDEKPASAAEFVLMVIFTLIIPIAGFVFGVIGLSRRGKEAQGGVLLGLSLIVAALYFFAYLTAHQ